MKKLLITTAVIFMTAFVSSQAKAELTLVTDNGGSFSFSPDGTMTSLTTGVGTSNTNGLTDLAFYVGYDFDRIVTDPTTGFPTSVDDATPQLLTGGTFTNTGNTGTYTFSPTDANPLTLANGQGDSVNISEAVVNFTLRDTTGTGGSVDPGVSLLYELSLTTDGVENANGALQSYVGFDFNGNSAANMNAPDTIAFGTEDIDGFGTSQATISSADGNNRLSLDTNFDAVPSSPSATASDNGPFDAFQFSIRQVNNLPDRFDGDQELPGPGGFLAFSAFSDFLSRDVDATFTTAGVVGFRSADAVAAAVPEPSALMMASMGLGMVAFRRRRKRLA